MNKMSRTTLQILVGVPIESLTVFKGRQADILIVDELSRKTKKVRKPTNEAWRNKKGFSGYQGK